MSSESKPHTPAPAEGVSPSASPTFWLRVIIVMQLVILAVEFSPDISTNGDDAKYYLLGNSLMSGNGYRDQFDPQNPVQTQYPPLFPLLLGAAGSVGHTPLVPKILVGLVCAATLLLLFRYVRPSHPALALPLVAAVAFSSAFASHATLLMSEIPYLFASIAALALYELYRKRGGFGWLFWLTALVSITPPFIRTVGIAFVAAWVLTAILDKRYSLAVASVALFAAAMLLMRFTTDWNSPYLDQLIRKNQYDPELGYATAGEMAGRIGQNIQLYLFSVLPKALLGIDLSRDAGIAVSVAVLAPTIYGAFRNLFSSTRFLTWYLVMYCGIICMWQTEWSSVRLLLPVLPFIAFFFLLGIKSIIDQVTPQQKDTAADRKHGLMPFVPAAMAVIIALFNVSGHFDLIQSTRGLPDDWKNFYSCADWIRLNSPSDAIVVSRKPELFFLRSERKGFIYPFSHDVEKVVDGLIKGKARYCILDNFAWTNTSPRYLFPAIMSHPEMFRVVYSLRNPDTYVLEVIAK